MPPLQAQIGIIGGSGLYEFEGLERVREVKVRTPFGPPSDAMMVGVVQGVPVAFLARHGRAHRIGPSEINYRANIHALKSIGVTRVMSVSAVGSMKESIVPGELVLPDQFIDLTKRRASTFFEQGVVAHVAFANPVCADLGTRVAQATHGVGVPVRSGGVYVCIEGPQFSTRAESRLYRQWGVDLIGMTNMPEAKLAREAEMCYTTLALVTDYDCWHEAEESVTVEAVLATLSSNVTTAKRVLAAAIPYLAGDRHCGCGEVLAQAILTSPATIPAAAKRRLALFLRPSHPSRGVKR